MVETTNLMNLKDNTCFIPWMSRILNLIEEAGAEANKPILCNKIKKSMANRFDVETIKTIFTFEDLMIYVNTRYLADDYII